MKRPVEWEKIFVSHILDKELISKIYKEFLQLSNKSNESHILKWAKVAEWIFFQRSSKMPTGIQRCSTALMIRAMQMKAIMRYCGTPRCVRCWDDYHQKGKDSKYG